MCGKCKLLHVNGRCLLASLLARLHNAAKRNSVFKDTTDKVPSNCSTELLGIRADVKL